MRIAVTGQNGQVARALHEIAGRHGHEVVLLGRPGLDLADPSTIAPALRAADAAAVINAAAYTAVDKAESEPDLALAVNGAGAGAVAAAAAELGLPVLQVSTDYVFDGAKPSPYVEEDPVGPLGAYGRSKLAGERAVAEANPRHAVLRTAWVYAPYGANFVRTMLRIAGNKPEVGVVADQHGCPTSALDIATTLLGVAARMVEEPEDRDLVGVFHMAARGEAVWADVAEAVFAASRAKGGPSATVKRITTADFPTQAQRPANSRLDCAKLERVYGIALPEWRGPLERTVSRLLNDAKTAG